MHFTAKYSVSYVELDESEISNIVDHFFNNQEKETALYRAEVSKFRLETKTLCQELDKKSKELEQLGKMLEQQRTIADNLQDVVLQSEARLEASAEQNQRERVEFAERLRSVLMENL